MNGAFTKRLQSRRGFKYDPRLLHAIARTLPVGSTVTDWGCGNAPFVYGLRDLGFRAYGVEGSHAIEGVSIKADISRPILLPATSAAITIETGEHIPEESLGTFVQNINRNTTSILIVSWAVRGQRGRDHVSCRNPNEVEAMFGEFKWVTDQRKTKRIRSVAGGPWSKKLLVMKRSRG
jgi:hypothetical protein